MHPVLGWFTGVIAAIQHLNDIVPQLLDEYYQKEQSTLAQTIDSLKPDEKILLYHAAETYKRMEQLHGTRPILWDVTDNVKDVWNKIFQNLFTEGHTKNFIREMSLVYLITTFEELEKQIFSMAYLKKPEMLSTKDDNMTIENIIKCHDYGTIISTLTNSKVSSIVNKNPIDLAEFLKNKFQLDLTQENDWNKFIERFYRRHLIVHQKGRIDQQYRNKTGYSGTDERVHTDKQYIADSLIIFQKFAETITKFFVEKYQI